MPQLDGTGPEGKGRKTGRGLGECSQLSEEEKLPQLGKGMGKKRKTDCTDAGEGKRLKSGKPQPNS